jgi:Domain of unknown function (DUF4253)
MIGAAMQRSDEPRVPFFARRPAPVPGEGMPTIAGVTLPRGRPRPDDDPFFWATDEPMTDPGRFTSPLAAAFPSTGLWPLLWEWEEAPANCYWQRPELNGLGVFGAEQVLRTAWESYAAEFEIEEPVGAFTGVAAPSLTPGGQAPTGDPFDEVNDETRRASWQPGRRLVLVPCTRPADVLAVLGWDYSQIPAPLVAAVLRSWQERFAAVPVQFEPSALTLHIGAPPTRMDQALDLAAEICAIAEAPLAHGATAADLAQILLTGHHDSDEFPLQAMAVSPTLWRFAFREYCTDALRRLATTQAD